MADPVSIAVNVALIAASTALTASQEFEGPRLDELKVTTADYGTPMSYVYGIRRLDGTSCIWAEPLTEVKRQRKTKGGKFNDYTYFGTWAQLVCDCPVEKILRIWFDRNLVYDATGAGPLSPFALEDGPGGPVGEVVSQLGLGNISQYMTFYLGTEDQEPDPRMAATVDAEFGEGSTPAYRGVTYIVFKDLPLEKLGNRLPQVSVEVATAAANAFPVEERETAWTPAMNNSWGLTYSPDGSRLYFGDGGQFEIWDVRARALMVSGEFSDAEGCEVLPDQRTWGVADDGSIYLIASQSGLGHRLIKYSADGGLERAIGHPDFAYFEFGDYCVVLKNGEDDPPYEAPEYVLMVRPSPETGGFLYLHGNELDPDPIEVLDPQASTGADWQIKFYFKDAYGNLWAAGGRGDLANNELGLWRIVGGVGGGPSGGIVTMPTTQLGAGAACAAFHYLSDTEDHFVVAWPLAGDNRLVIVDRLTMTATADVPATLDARNFRQQFQAIPPGASTFWDNKTEFSSADLSTIRTIDYGDWGYPALSGLDRIYDPLNHAMIVAINTDEIAWLYLDRAAGDGVLLSSIVEDVCERAGLVDGLDFDASDLTQTVTGYSWTHGTGKAIIGPLLEAYDSEARPHDFLTEFLRRGVAVGASIPVADMGAGGGLRYQIQSLGDTDLPLKVNLTFADVDRDQQSNTAIAQRAGEATDSRRELSLDASTLATDADDGRVKSEGYLRREWMRAQTVQTALTRAYTALEPGDARSLVCDDVTVSAKLKKLEFGANGVLTTEWERYAPSIHGATGLGGAPADGLIPDEVPAFGYTKGLALDIPLVVDSDDATQPFVYLAAAPYSDTPWPGATFYRSDDGTTFEEELGAVAASEVATIGYAMSALPDALATCWDNASAVTVKMFEGTLESSTKALVGNGANLALLGDEIIGFTTATLIATDTYQLSGLIRGRRGTEWATATHATGERFVLLDSLPRATMSSSDVGADVYVRPTTSGGSNGFVQHLDNYTGAALKPYAPAHLEVEESAGDFIVTWTRRTRVGGTWRDYQDVPLGEGSEAYIGRILDSGGNIIRTFSGLTSPTLTYTAAQIAADGSPAGVSVEVAQVSATVGNGFFSEAALA